MPRPTAACSTRPAPVAKDDDAVRADGLQLVRPWRGELGASPHTEPRSREDAVLLQREHVVADVVALGHRARALNEAFDRPKKSGHGSKTNYPTVTGARVPIAFTARAADAIDVPG